MSRWERQSHRDGVGIAEVRKSEGGGLLESPKPKLLRNWNSPKTVLLALLWGPSGGSSEYCMQTRHRAYWDL